MSDACTIYDVTRYDINLLQIRSPSGGSRGQTCTKIGKRRQKMRNNTQNNIKRIQKHRIHKTENKQRNKHKKEY